MRSGHVTIRLKVERIEVEEVRDRSVAEVRVSSSTKWGFIRRGEIAIIKSVTVQRTMWLGALYVPVVTAQL